MGEVDGNILEVQDLFFSFSGNLNDAVLKNISFEVKKNEIIGLLGPNGCGKTTLINLIAEFLEPTKGFIEKKSIEGSIFSSLIFQEVALLDWKKVRGNIELGLISKDLDQKEKDKIINRMIDLLKLAGHENKFPKQLSGGLKQRVAIGRALAPNPSLLLMDEPFSALDVNSKNSLLKDIRKIILDKDHNLGAIFISHNIEEIVSFCDRVIVLDPFLKSIGTVLKIGSSVNESLTGVFSSFEK